MTPKILADALGCFWNAAAGAARERQSLQAIEVADVLTAGIAAVAARLEEHGEERDRRVSELLEANNRYQQEARDARDAITAILKMLYDEGTYQGGRELWAKATDIAAADGFAARPAPAGEQVQPPTPPWTPGARDNGKIEGWLAFFTGRDRESCPFPPARADLQAGFRVGWDAADQHQKDNAR